MDILKTIYIHLFEFQERYYCISIKNLSIVLHDRCKTSESSYRFPKSSLKRSKEYSLRIIPFTSVGIISLHLFPSLLALGWSWGAPLWKTIQYATSVGTGISIQVSVGLSTEGVGIRLWYSKYDWKQLLISA